LREKQTTESVACDLQLDKTKARPFGNLATNIFRPR
jgi:hypothetical protein